MPTRYRLALGGAERMTLELLHDHGPKAYWRERAAVRVHRLRVVFRRTAP
jgi:hypothetical protein